MNTTIQDIPAILDELIERHERSVTNLRRAIAAYLSDRTLPDIHRRCLALFAEVSGPQAAASRETASLAKRELECIRLAADGLTSGDIARRLGLSLHTANQYLAEAAHKLNANGRMHAVAKALRLGLID